MPFQPRLKLTDFLDLDALREVQESFALITRLRTTIRDAEGEPLTGGTSDAAELAETSAALDHLITPEADERGGFTAPIVVDEQRLGSITIEPPSDATDTAKRAAPEEVQRFRSVALGMGLADDDLECLMEAAHGVYAARTASSVQLVVHMANAIARLFYEKYHASQRVNELSALYKVSQLLSGTRDLQQTLDTAAATVAEVMQVKASSIRLMRNEKTPTSGGREVRVLVPRAVYNLSETYINKGTIGLEESSLFKQALSGEAVYVEDMANDPRVLYPVDAEREGLTSMLCIGMTYQRRPIGTLQLFTAEPRRFSQFEIRLARAIAELLATAAESAQLENQRTQNEQMVRQLHLAADVQQRMLPQRMPNRPPFEVAARYVPSFELGGDFYDFLSLETTLGVAIGDVVGKGVAASLLMAGVRASLRAYAQDVYDLDEIIERVNAALCRDTRDNEFATLWYGTLDPRAMRLTYCNAGHEPPMLLRGEHVIPLDTGGMIVGVDATQGYDKGLVDLLPGDLLLLYTDGMLDTFDGDGRRFGRDRLAAALREVRDKPVHEVLNHLLWQQRKHRAGRPATDDTTLVVVRVGD